MHKRFLLLLMVCAMLFSAVACSSEEANDINTDPTATEAPAVQPEKVPDSITAEPDDKPSENPGGAANSSGSFSAVTGTPEPESMQPDIDENREGTSDGQEKEPSEVQEYVPASDPSEYSYYDVVTEDDLIIGFTDTTDAALYSAEHTIKSLLNYDSKRYIDNILVISDDTRESLDELCFQLDLHKKHAERKGIHTELKVKAIGGYRVTEDELFSNSWFAVSEEETEFTDYQCFCVKAEADVEKQGKYVLYFYVGVGKYGDRFYLASLDDCYLTEVERYEGGVEYYDFFDELDPELADFEEYFYQFTGKETAEEIAELFISSTLKYDVYTMVSCLAIDEEYEEDVVYSILYYRENPDENIPAEEIALKVGKARTPTEEEMDEMDATYQADISSIEEKVIVSVEADYVDGGEPYHDNIDICLGKTAEGYRVIGMKY